MEGRTLLTCADCGRTRQISGELPAEYTACFTKYVGEEGWVPRPGNAVLICGACAANYAGHETVDDEENLRGLRVKTHAEPRNH